MAGPSTPATLPTGSAASRAARFAQTPGGGVEAPPARQRTGGGAFFRAERKLNRVLHMRGIAT